MTHTDSQSQINNKADEEEGKQHHQCQPEGIANANTNVTQQAILGSGTVVSNPRFDSLWNSVGYKKVWHELNNNQKQAFADWGGFSFTPAPATNIAIDDHNNRDGDGDGDGNGNGNGNSVEVMLDENNRPFSKSGLKKQLKRYQSSVKLKMKRKEYKRRKKKRKRKEFEENTEKNTSDGNPNPNRIPSKRRKLLKGSKLRRYVHQKLEANAATNINVVIDCRFNHLMDTTQLISVAKQIRQLYGLNVRAQNPCKLYLTSFGGSLKQHLLKSLGCFGPNTNITAAMLNDLCMEFDARSLEECFADRAKQDIIYLTADCEQDLDAEDFHRNSNDSSNHSNGNNNPVLVIGGLVDRNRHKGCTAKIAAQNGWAMRRLPILEYMSCDPQNKTRLVITVNQVFAILVAFAHFRDWRKAFHFAFPRRKGFVLKEPLTETQISELIFDGNYISMEEYHKLYPLALSHETTKPKLKLKPVDRERETDTVTEAKNKKSV